MTSIFKSARSAKTKSNNIHNNIENNDENPNLLITESSISSITEKSDREENTDYIYILNYSDIKKTIPEGSVKNEMMEMIDNGYTEWRWRFFNYKGRRLVEISKKEPNKDRIYIDNKQRWVVIDMDKYWDDYLIDSYYYYALQG